MKQKIELIPIWVTRGWSSEIKKGVGFTQLTINDYGSEKSITHFKEDGQEYWKGIDSDHVHKSFELALDRAKRETMAYADFNEKKSAEYKESAQKVRSELIKLNKL